MKERLTSSLDPRRRMWRKLLGIGAVLLILLACLRPWWGTRLVDVPVISRDVIVILDSSRSMLAKDVAPSRMMHAKRWVKELFKKLPGDRFGIISFSGDAFVECPMTFDRNTLDQTLGGIAPGEGVMGGTNVERALETARKAFKGAEGAHLGVILITDGDELQGDSSKELDFFKDNKIPLYVVGLGNPGQGSMIQLEGGTYLRDSSGEVVYSKLNESGLRKLSSETGGVYVRTTALQLNIDPIGNKLKGLSVDKGMDMKSKKEIERYQIPLLLGLLLLLIRFFIGERRVAATAAFLLCTSLFAQNNVDMKALDLNPKGNKRVPLPELSEGPSPEILEQIARLKGRVEDAGDEDAARLCFNLGALKHVAGDAEGAREAYEQALEQKVVPDAVQARTWQNLSALKQMEAEQAAVAEPDKSLEQLEEASLLNREAMRLIPGDAEIAGNQERLEKTRNYVEQIKKLQQQMKQQMQDAADKTQKALEDQQRASQQQNEQGKRKQQQQAEKSTREAQKAMENLSKQAEKMGAEEAAQKFKEVEEQLSEAQKNQRDAQKSVKMDEQKMKDAEKNLAQASRMMGMKPEEENKEGDKGQSGKEEKGQAEEQQENQTASADEEQQEQKGEPQQQATASRAEDDQPIDEARAEAALEKMGEEELNLRNYLKMRERNENRNRGNDKNW